MVGDGTEEVDRGGPYSSRRTMHTQTMTLGPGATTTTTRRRHEHRAAPHHHSDTSRPSWNVTSAGEYTLDVFDSFGDGFCCEYGNGNVSLTVDGYVLWTLSGYARPTPMPLECPRLTDRVAPPRVTHSE